MTQISAKDSVGAPLLQMKNHFMCCGVSNQWLVDTHKPHRRYVYKAHCRPDTGNFKKVNQELLLLSLAVRWSLRIQYNPSTQAAAVENYDF